MTRPAIARAQGKALPLALAFMGLAHLTVLRQRVKGVVFAFVEIIFLLLLPDSIGKLGQLVTLGEPQLELPVKQRGNSMFMLIDGVMTLAMIALFAVLYYISVRSALADEHRQALDGKQLSVREQFGAFANSAFHVVGLAPAVILVLFFVIVPLIFSACVAFTNYSAPDHIPPAKTVDWVGLENFERLFSGEAEWAGALTRVFVWTVVWAMLATLTCYFGGMLMAVLLQESKLRIKPFFRAVFILPYAIPVVVSMLVWRNLLNGAFGQVNQTLMAFGLIDQAIGWLSDPWLAKFAVVMINLWAGFPYFMLLTFGAMTAISPDVTEAARLDGATGFQRFRHITLPLVLYQTAPLIIISFAHNINNFGAVFFLTMGDPTVEDSTVTGAGGTDIMVSWIYKLTITLMKYNYASVLAVVIFVVLAPFAIFNFRRTKSFKEGEL
ncbi:MAG: sugar ABC transporter permease [Propionibacteriaceae bacterium]|jgi:arabinogalactan oligomer/maltooligosaccharide transport system permease protein|nr:sugar ABC transporter permease [Propionibacteriaceae bacterium]